MQTFTEVLNDFFDLWLLADPEVLTRFQRSQDLPDDLISTPIGFLCQAEGLSSNTQ